MQHKSEIMLIGRSQDAMSGILGLLESQQDLSLQTRLFDDGLSDIWRDNGHSPTPHVLVLCVDDDWPASLPPLLQELPVNRPPFLVLCPNSDIDLMRTAMRAGARDVLSPPYEVDDLTAHLVALANENQAACYRKSAHMVAFINAKGGSGASFLAANIASVLAERHQRKPMLVDFDLQFGSLPVYLNMGAGNGLIKVLESIDDIDVTALQGYVQRNKNGLHLLSAAIDNLIIPDDIPGERVERLMDVLNTAYKDIIVDLPQRIDRPTAAILQRLDRVMVVTQQSVSHLRDTNRLMAILRTHLGIPPDRIVIVLNRFSKKAEVRLEDFSDAFPESAIETIPSDYAKVSEAINLGVPIIESAPTSQLSKALIRVSDHLLPEVDKKPKQSFGLFGWLRSPARHRGNL